MGLEYANIDRAVLSSLRSTEQLTITLETNVPSTGDGSNASPKRNSVSQQFDLSISTKGKRILAIVVHKYPDNGTEEGGLFVFKYRSRTLYDGIRLQGAYAITTDFAINISQAKSDAPSQASVNLSHSEFILTLRSHDGHVKPWSIKNQDTQRLQRLLAECSRLKSTCDNNTSLPGSHAWIAPYIRKQKQLSPLVDIRNTQQPLHLRLSSASAGLSADDFGDIEIIREDWIRKTALESCKSVSPKVADIPLRLRVGTFNVNGKTPSQDLSVWVSGNIPAPRGVRGATFIPPVAPVSPFEVFSDPMDDISSLDASGGSYLTIPNTRSELSHNLFSDKGATGDIEDIDPDVLVLGFQELDLSTEALLYSTSTAKEEVWLTAVFAALGEKAVLYQKLASRQLVGMLLLVVVKRGLAPCFNDIRSSVAGSGIMGVMGNKGATALRMAYTPNKSTILTNPRPIVLTFVNSHLAAFDEMVDRRNFDFHELSRKLAFNDPTSEYSSGASPPSGVTVPGVYDTDVLFWMGDLNYRLDLDDSDIRSLLKSHSPDINNIEILLQYDQLTNTIRTGKAFVGFLEHTITHLPTYRYSNGFQTDDLGYDMKRKPAWTDRILYMSNSLTSMESLSYQSHSEITMSDHRPLSGEFDLHVEDIDNEQYNNVVADLFREVARFEESETTPKLKLDTATVEVGRIFYKKQARQILKIENIGTIPSAFRFVPISPDVPICPQWIKIEPTTGLLRPGEYVEIEITAFVDNDAATKLNMVSSHLDCMLILHTLLGQDHFITVHGEYQYTCFANPLSRLVRLPGPIRSVSPQEALPNERPVTVINAPREVMRLINWLMTHASDTHEIFTSPAEETLVDNIRECLDTGDDFPPLTSENSYALALAFGSTLLQFLDSLSEPLVPPALHARCADTRNRDEAFELLDEFPTESVNVWISCTAFLHYISQQDSPNSLPTQSIRAQVLAHIFAPVLLRDDSSHTIPRISPVNKQDFLLHFIR